MLPPVSLRQWTERDLDPFVDLNSDPEVMRFFPRPLTRAETEASFLRFSRHIDGHGWGLWVVDVEDQFAGFCGLARPTFDAPFMPCVEVGWRLRRCYWGRGIGLSAATQAVAYGFDQLRLPELVSFTSPLNRRSIALMERLGFNHEPEFDFLHPRLEEGHPLCPHVFYRKRASSRILPAGISGHRPSPG